MTVKKWGGRIHQERTQQDVPELQGSLYDTNPNNAPVLQGKSLRITIHLKIPELHCLILMFQSLGNTDC